jgi:hypothetical protein
LRNATDGRTAEGRIGNLPMEAEKFSWGHIDFADVCIYLGAVFMSTLYFDNLGNRTFAVLGVLLTGLEKVISQVPW